MSLTNWAINFLMKKGFTSIITPDVANTMVVEACGFQPRDESSQVYFLDGKGECLIGTSEIPLAGMFANEVLKKECLPLKYVGLSHCFRKEAGKGENSKGLYRLHQFTKVEMFSFTKGDYEESNKIHEEFLHI